MALISTFDLSATRDCPAEMQVSEAGSKCSMKRCIQRRLPCPKREQLMTCGRPASEPSAKMLKSSSRHTSTTAARDICNKS